jgi:hypothetical protein
MGGRSPLCWKNLERPGNLTLQRALTRKARALFGSLVALSHMFRQRLRPILKRIDLADRRTSLLEKTNVSQPRCTFDRPF